MRPKINLPSGASIVIESTEALTVIDVNSGKFTGGRNLEDTILKTNIEAAEEIARQVRLRDIGGIIVVDFIDMASEASRNKVVQARWKSTCAATARARRSSRSRTWACSSSRASGSARTSARSCAARVPTCAGMGSVMSAQSVAIETFRHISDQANHTGSGEVVAHVAPTVAVQMDYWYEDECQELARSIERPVHVRVDPMIHPEKARIEVVGSAARAEEPSVRVGDEHDVELLPGRLPNATSAVAVVAERLAEVEDAANNAGNFARIRIIDVDDDADHVLAELVTAGAAKPRRKRRGRRAELTAAEQTRQLRELAEDAARQSAARPPIGISAMSEEEEAQDKELRAERKGEAQPDAIIIGQGAAAHEGEDGHRKRRRRRRGRGGRGGGNGETSVAATVTPAPAPQQPETQPPADGDGQRRRRRRRGRRGRGRGGAAGAAMPDRHIFEVGSDGATHPTGTTAPPEPSRAIAAVRKAPPAVDAPPPSLRAPADEPKATKPARRRKTTRSKAAGELASAPKAVALPAAADEPKSTRRPRKPRGAAAEAAPAPVTETKPKAAAKTTRKRKTTATASSRKKS